jgi:LEA14-like dessication related protein
MLALLSCGNFNDVHISVDHENVKINSVKGSRFKLNIPVEINNPTSKKLILKKTNVDVLKNGYSFAKLELNDRIEITANSHENYMITLNGKIVDPFATIFSNFSFKNTQSEVYSFTGFIKAGTKTFSKKIKFKNIDFETLINSFKK